MLDKGAIKVGDSPKSKGVCIPDLSSTQKGLGPSASGKPKGTEQVHCGGALQGGGLPHDKRPGTTS